MNYEYMNMNYEIESLLVRFVIHRLKNIICKSINWPMIYIFMIANDFMSYFLPIANILLLFIVVIYGNLWNMVPPAIHLMFINTKWK